MAQKSDKELQQMLSSVPLFSGVSKKHLRAIAHAGKIVDWKAGRVGVQQGSKGAAFFLILDGGVEVSRDGKPLARLHPNDFFGETALLTGKPRNAQVAATTDTSLFALSRISFAGAVKSEPELGLQIMSAMAERAAASL